MKSKIRTRIEVTAFRRQSLVHSGERIRPDFEEPSGRRDESTPGVPSTNALLEIAAQALRDNLPVTIEANRMEQWTALVRTLIEAESQGVRARQLEPRRATSSGILKLKSWLRRLRTALKAGPGRGYTKK